MFEFDGCNEEELKKIYNAEIYNVRNKESIEIRKILLSILEENVIDKNEVSSGRKIRVKYHTSFAGAIYCPQVCINNLIFIDYNNFDFSFDEDYEDGLYTCGSFKINFNMDSNKAASISYYDYNENDKGKIDKIMKYKNIEGYTCILIIVSYDC